MKSLFEARTAGFHGGFMVARSMKIFWPTPTSKSGEPDDNRKSREALDEIVTKLPSDGWVCHGKSGVAWWELLSHREQKAHSFWGGHNSSSLV